ncbi:hypothetical protein DERP_010085 [Dermatophagoides pteronyssinus]|uniref:Uncharacterized protein n=1 Tax=Dermatophagoides pteronyssinus TaxID=6956 RepID=A0ABQ8JEW7_DERPT|nr:hypothetical protein DERP_010085 [Dermatophagoides pteronyssinus]
MSSRITFNDDDEKTIEEPGLYMEFYGGKNYSIIFSMEFNMTGEKNNFIKSVSIIEGLLLDIDDDDDDIGIQH